MGKKGSSSLEAMIIFTIIIIALFSIFVFMVNSIMPLIYYQKIDNIATKYMFVIEKFGYLTSDEKDMMVNELKEAGLDETKIDLVYPSYRAAYGQLVELGIKYRYVYKFAVLGGLIKNKETIISVKKNSFSKVY